MRLREPNAVVRVISCLWICVVTMISRLGRFQGLARSALDDPVWSYRQCALIPRAARSVTAQECRRAVMGW